jgi:hypothetical protein
MRQQQPQRSRRLQRECHVAGKICSRTKFYEPGAPVATHVRRRSDSPHPDRGITTPCYDRKGWCIDWLFPLAVIAIIALVILL